MYKREVGLFQKIEVLFQLICSVLPQLLGCAPTWTHQVHLEPFDTSLVCIDLPPEEKQEAKRAVETWSVALAGWKRLQSVDGDCSNYTFSIEETDSPPSDDASALAYTILGKYHIKMVHGRYSKETTYGIVLHEMGHGFGAQHVNSTLMDPNYRALTMQCPDYTTMLQVAAWQHVPMEYFSWCY